MQNNLIPLMADYAAISTSTIGHVLEVGYLPHIHAINKVDHVVGRVKTVILDSVNAANLRQSLLDSEPNDVLVIDARAIDQRACWGEQRHRAAIFHQIAAVVVLGAVTDVMALRTMKVPVFARTISCLTTRNLGESKVRFDEEIVVGDTCIATGDLMIGDADGVFILKPEQAQQLLSSFQALEEQERVKRTAFFKQHSIHDYYHLEQSF